MEFNLTSININSNNQTLSYLKLAYLLPFKIALGVINIIFNGYIIVLVLVIVKNKSYSNMLFLSGALADLMIGILSIPFLTLTTSVGFWPLGKSACIFWVINDFSIGSISIYTLLIMAVHRYFQIKFPLNESEKMTTRKYGVILAQWILVYLFWAISVIIITQVDFIPENCYFTYTFPYVIVADLVGYGLPVLGVFVVNSMVFYELLKRTKANKRREPKVLFTSDKFTITRGTMSVLNSSMNLDSTRSQSNSTTRQSKDLNNRREFKALVCLYVIAGILILLFAIFCITWPLKALCSECVSDLILELGYWLSYIYSSLNPILLLIFHEKFKIEFFKTFKKIKIILKI